VNPVILGRITLTNGEIFFLGKRYELAGGTIAFNNPVRTQPELDLNVATQVEQYNVTLHLEGTLERLRTSYTSDPALAPLDIINLIAFGQTTAEQQSASAGSSATSGAESVIANGLSGQATGRIANAVGLSQLTIDPLAGSSNDPGAQIAIQQRVTGNLLLTFSTDVTSTQASAVQLQYQIDPKWQISVIRDVNGGYGIDLRLHKSF
jgi:translocation and assembly module TamB